MLIRVSPKLNDWCLMRIREVARTHREEGRWPEADTGKGHKADRPPPEAVSTGRGREGPSLEAGRERGLCYPDSGLRPLRWWCFVTTALERNPGGKDIFQGHVSEGREGRTFQ